MAGLVTFHPGRHSVDDSCSYKYNLLQYDYFVQGNPIDFFQYRLNNNLEYIKKKIKET